MAGEVTTAVSVGDEVFCPLGHGNRIIDHHDVRAWPFPCPQCGSDWTAERPAIYESVDDDLTALVDDEDLNTSWSFNPEGD